MKNVTRTTLLGTAVMTLVLSTAPLVAAGGRAPDAAPAATRAPVGRATVPDSVAVVPSDEGIHVVDISSSTITLAAGDTFVYTVDTPEGQGRTTLEVRTVDQLLKEITSRSGSAQTYAVEDSHGAQQHGTDPVVPGDVLTVTAGHRTHDYTIKVVRAAVRGRLGLPQDEITANTSSDVVLNFTSGMRSPATDVLVKVPRGIHATMDNTTVNVIGRGEVRLSGLATQSIGRVGAGYRFHRVGTVAIENARDGSQVIRFHGLDLRPSNGTDLQIRFTHVSVKQGSYAFEAS
jgi:hypothetical protein